jgi:hypothetical protein
VLRAREGERIEDTDEEKEEEVEAAAEEEEEEEEEETDIRCDSCNRCTQRITGRPVCCNGWTRSFQRMRTLHA